MAWIRTIAEEDARDRLAVLYERSVDPESGRVDNILAVHSLHPRGLEAHLALYKAVMKATATLPKADREMVAVVVSRINECDY